MSAPGGPSGGTLVESIREQLPPIRVQQFAFPLALLAMIVIAPLLVNVVIRTYGWRIILANADNGVLNWLLAGLGIGHARILYTEWAIVIGSVHVFLPLMVLPLITSLHRLCGSHCRVSNGAEIGFSRPSGSTPSGAL